MNQYQAVVIGASMSGIAAAIRLAMSGKKVCIVEQHTRAGGLNSYYHKNKQLIDSGLHAMTNFATKAQKQAPLIKITKQLRIPYETLNLKEQLGSEIWLGGKKYRFSNQIDLFSSEIATHFPTEIENYKNFLKHIEEFKETDLSLQYQSAREVLQGFFRTPELIEIMMMPVLIYGSSWENDIDWSQFVIMFKSIFLEGFCKPHGGVKSLLDILIKRAKEEQVEIFYGLQVQSLEKAHNQIIVKTTKADFYATQVYSSAGLPETNILLGLEENSSSHGQLAFTETIIELEKKPNTDSSIIFYNKSTKYNYRRSKTLYDLSSAVFCFPNNFQDHTLQHQIRVTLLSNFTKWQELTPDQYLRSKASMEQDVLNLLQEQKLIASHTARVVDSFTPLTIKRYTGRINGAIYGSTTKIKTGITPVKNVFLIGTDQGFLGITGALLSGISIANLHGVMES